MVHITHNSFTRYVLLLRRNVVVCCLFQGNAPVHKSNITQAAIQYTDLTELNHPAYSSDIAPRDYHPFSNLKDFLRSRNFDTDDEAIMIMNHYLENHDSDYFLETQKADVIDGFV